MMKKLMAVLLAALLLLNVPMSLAEPLAGGWTVAESTALTEEQLALFAKATEGLLGVGYEPVAYLGSQVVAGRNHCYLCKAQTVYPDAAPYLTLVYIYEDLNGGATVTRFAPLDLGALSVEPVEEGN